MNIEADIVESRKGSETLGHVSDHKIGLILARNPCTRKIERLLVHCRPRSQLFGSDLLSYRLVHSVRMRSRLAAAQLKSFLISMDSILLGTKSSFLATPGMATIA